MSADNAANFHILTSRYRLQGVLETKTALRIGSGGAGAFDGSDLPVLRDADGFPLIPGSSLKGSIRSTCEALIRGAGFKRGGPVWSCDPLSDEAVDGEYTCGRHKSTDARGPNSKRADAQQQAHCTVCQLFGSRVIASHVRFTDALLADAHALKTSGRIPIEVRDGVAIDRDLRTVHGGQKYDFEVVAPGTRFELEVFIENPTPPLLGLLAVGLEQVSEGFSALGGFTSRGLGRVTIEWTSLTKFDAKVLLRGGDVQTVSREALAQEFATWRAALASTAKGAA